MTSLIIPKKNISTPILSSHIQKFQSIQFTKNQAQHTKFTPIYSTPANSCHSHFLDKMSRNPHFSIISQLYRSTSTVPIISFEFEMRDIFASINKHCVIVR
ncbi:hypothetical protein ACKWTF_014874 [Chironomus riparius]